MSGQKTFWDSSSATSSPGSEAGRLLSNSPDGTAPVGLEAVPASRSRRRASGKGIKMTETSGPNSCDSSASAALRPSSGSKSHPQKLSALSRRLLSLSRFATAITPEQTSSLNDSLKASPSITTLGGSIEYKQTWREKVTPSGVRYWEHTASARRTSDSGCSGWPTPQNHDGTHGARSDASAEKRGGRCLQREAKLTGWASPTAQDYSRGVSPPRPTDTGIPLSQQVSGLTGWATPAHRDSKSESASDELNQDRLEQMRGKPLSWQVAETGCAAFALNAAFSGWLMGFHASRSPSAYPSNETIPGWDTCSPGWENWATVQRLLEEYSPTHDETASGD